jgi:hypothetical protein
MSNKKLKKSEKILISSYFVQELVKKGQFARKVNFLLDYVQPQLFLSPLIRFPFDLTLNMSGINNPS